MDALFTLVVSTITCCIGVSIGMSIAKDRNRRRKEESNTIEVEDLDYLGKELELTRKKIGIPMQEADERAGFSDRTVRNIEQGHNHFSSFRKALQYAHTLGIDKIIIHLKE
jgi:hypothetical protein